MKIEISHDEVVEIIIKHIQSNFPEWKDSLLYAQNERFDESKWEIGEAE